MARVLALYARKSKSLDGARVMAALKLKLELATNNSFFRLSDNKAGHKEELHSCIAPLLGALKMWAYANQTSKDASRFRSHFE